MTKTTNVEQLQPTLIDETSVMQYLKHNPDALERHPQILSQLTFPHESGVAVSLVERQIKVLRDDNQQLRNRLTELVHIARENEELSQRFHRLSLELMAGEHLHDIIAMTHDQVETFFYTDYVGFCFHDNLTSQLKGLEKSILDPENKHAANVRHWIQQRKPVFGPFDPGMRQLLLGDQGQLTSCALIPLYHTRDIGLLILASKSKDRFVDGMGTVFLSQLGELISSKIKQFLN
ncbi:MAG: DUF484 family protein [Gammaproteobacteria bacterium]|nr:DUF484 family protein [Gammaproteobacteria bacterium]